jgi:hypothetical protein
MMGTTGHQVSSRAEQGSYQPASMTADKIPRYTRDDMTTLW